MAKKNKQSKAEARLEDLEEGLEGDADIDSNDDSDQLIDFAEKIREFESQVEDHHNKYLRALAELENHKKRAIKERSDLIKYAGEHIARDLLEVVDNLERAVSQEASDKNEDFKKGVELILNQFQQVLGKHSIRAESSKGEKFNPDLHQAISTVPSGEHEPGTIIEEFQKPYYFKDKLLRPGVVVVAAEKSEEKGQEEGQEDEVR
jgi:molecular chaperone GrpE